MATSNKKTAASSAKKRTTSSGSKRTKVKFQDNFFKRNKMALIIFVLLFGGIGAYFLVESHAETWVFFHAGSQSGPCISSSTIRQCDQSNSDGLFVDGTGSTATDNFHLRSKAGYCLDDWGGAKQTVPGSANRVYAHYSQCSDGDANQQWYWAGQNNHMLKNVASGGCLNVAGSVAIGNPLIVYSCTGDNNELFFKSQPPSSPPTSGGGGGTTATNCDGNTSGAYRALVGPGAVPSRTDQGKDFEPANPGTPYAICAPASGTITLADQTGHAFRNTPGTAEIIMHLDYPPPGANGTTITQYIYFAELITLSANARVGNHVSKGTVLGHNSYTPGIEVGWAPNGQYGFSCSDSSGAATTCGNTFVSWVLGQAQ